MLKKLFKKIKYKRDARIRKRFLEEIAKFETEKNMKDMIKVAKNKELQKI